jgi:hypothetical protein
MVLGGGAHFKEADLAFDSDDTHEHTRGRPFAEGNPGRKAGSKNRVTLVLEALHGETSELVRKAFDSANAGNGPMLRFFLGILLPKDRMISIELPELTAATDAVDAMAIIVKAVATGQISPSEGAQVAALVTAFVKALHVADLEKRLSTVEKTLEKIR